MSLGLAAALVVAIVGLRYLELTTASYATRKGEQQTVTLPDGSAILLNTDTALDVRFTGDRRTVAMTCGEALFTVMHDVKRPFEVVAGAGRVRDIGTRFNVYAKPERVAVAVLEGKVAISTDQTPAAQSLSAGQSVSYNTAGALSAIGPVDVRALSAWQVGKLIFDDLPLPEVLDQVARYHAVEFVLADPALRKLKISGAFNINSLLLFLTTLEAGFAIKAEVLDAARIRLSRRRH